MKMYRYVVSLFLGYVQRRIPNQEPLLWYAWDKDLFRGFFSCLETVAKPSSLVNFYSGMTSVHHYLNGTGNRPQDHIELLADFDRQAASAHRQRRQYIASEKQLSVREKGLLRLFYLEVYHNERLWDDYNNIVEDIKYAISSERKVKPAISKKKLTFATSFMLTIVTACNSNALVTSAFLSISLRQTLCFRHFPVSRSIFQRKKLEQPPALWTPQNVFPRYCK